MMKFITQALSSSRGGRFSDVCSRLAKSALTAFALTAATFAVHAEEVISINFVCIVKENNNEIEVTPVGTDLNAHGIVSVPGTAWYDFIGGTGTDQAIGVYNTATQKTSEADEAKVSWSSSGNWSWNGTGETIMNGYLDDNGNRVVITLTGVPFAYYDAIVYYNSDNNNLKFAPVSFNGGDYYRWDDVSGEAVVALGKADTWGATCQNNTFALGTNVIRVNGLTTAADGTIVIRTHERSNSRGSVAAIQIVEAVAAIKPAAPDFFYGPDPAVAPTGWFTAWGNEGDLPSLGANRMIGPEGVDVLALGSTATMSGYPYGNNNDVFNGCKALTIAAVINVDNVKPAEDKYAVIWSAGRAKGRSLVLLKNGGKLYLQNAKQQNFTPGEGSPYCVSGDIAPGYHLVVATFDVDDDRLTLTIDGETTPAVDISDGNRLQALGGGNSGFALGSGITIGPNGTWNDSIVVGEGAVFDRVLGWNSALTEVQLADLWNSYRPLTASPIVPSYNTAFQQDGAKYYIPDIEKEGYQLKINQGTMVIPSDVTATVSSVWLGNSADDLVYGLDLAGVLNVDSDTGYQIYRQNDQGTANGLLFGHWHGRGTVNVTGTLAATNAFIETAYTIYELVFNIDGGTVTTRGLYAQNANSAINVSNGGTLEFAHFQNSYAIPLTAGEGTIRAIASGEYTAGWKYNGDVAFTDGENGTTLDPNGKDIEFLSEAAFSGNIIVDDTSAAGNGTVKLDAVSGTGTFSVLNGALYLPVDHGLTAAEGTVEDANGSTSEYKKYVNVNYEAEYVAQAKADGAAAATRFYSVEAAIDSLHGAPGTVTLLANCAAEAVTLAVGQYLDTAGFSIGTVSAAEGAVVALINGVWNSFPADTPEVWTGAGGDNDRWTNPANWDKGFVPLATTPVTFPAGDWTVTLTTSGNDTEQCGTLTLDGNVQFNRANNNWTELYVNGDIGGDGTLTLNYVGLRNMADADLEISCPLVITGGDTVIRAQKTYGWTISRSLELRGYLKVQDATSIDVTCPTDIWPTEQTILGLLTTLNFIGKTTLHGDIAKFDRWANGFAVFGDIDVVDNATLPNGNSRYITLDGAVTVDAGKVLTVPAETIIGENASFDLKGLESAVFGGNTMLTAENVSCSAPGHELYHGVGTWVVIGEATWIGGVYDANGNMAWNTADNWSTKTVPTQFTRVIFNNGAKVYVTGNPNCGGIVINGNVEIEGPGGANEVQLYNGNIVGSGTLTFSSAGVKRQDSSEGTIAEDISVVFRRRDGETANSWLSRGMTVNGSVSLGDEINSWDAQNTINGVTTFREATFKTNGGGANLVFGPIHVTKDFELDKGGPKVILNGEVTIDARKTLTIETDDEGKVQIGDDASFVLSSTGSKLVDKGKNIDPDKVKQGIARFARIEIEEDDETRTFTLRLVGTVIRVY